MKTKAQNQSKFMRVMTIPVRVLCKARDVYVKSMTDFSMRMSNDPSMALLAGQHPPLPRSFSVGSSRSDDGEDYRQLVRAASARSLGHSNEIEMYMQQLRQQQSSMTMGSKKVLPKSSSVGMRCMGRIDEDKSCVFEEGGVDVKPQIPPLNSFLPHKPKDGTIKLKLTWKSQSLATEASFLFIHNFKKKLGGPTS